jgi:hypothetical protein
MDEKMVELGKEISLVLDTENIKFMIFGSLAASFYGLEREPQDLDFAISSETEMNKTIRLTKKLGLQTFYSNLNREQEILKFCKILSLDPTEILSLYEDEPKIFFSTDNKTGITCDFHIFSTPYRVGIIERATIIEGLKIISLDDLIGLKLFCGRKKDFADGRKLIVRKFQICDLDTRPTS